jgi:hypothetical protein
VLDTPGLCPSSAPNPLFSGIQAVIDQFGQSPPTATKSRRHGHQPQAKQHVENYLAYRVLGQTVRGIARASGKAPSTVSGSIRRGERLVRQGSEARGFLAPDGQQLDGLELSPGAVEQSTSNRIPYRRPYRHG